MMTTAINAINVTATAAIVIVQVSIEFLHDQSRVLAVLALGFAELLLRQHHEHRHSGGE